MYRRRAMIADLVLATASSARIESGSQASLTFVSRHRRGRRQTTAWPAVSRPYFYITELYKEILEKKKYLQALLLANPILIPLPGAFCGRTHGRSLASATSSSTSTASSWASIAKFTGLRCAAGHGYQNCFVKLFLCIGIIIIIPIQI